jgi:hypothetical protein
MINIHDSSSPVSNKSKDLFVPFTADEILRAFGWSVTLFPAAFSGSLDTGSSVRSNPLVPRRRR